MEDDEEKVQEENISTVESTPDINTVKGEATMAAASTISNEETYSTQYLIDNCKALGYKKEVVAGALFGYEKTEMTKTEFETKIEEFLGKAVK